MTAAQRNKGARGEREFCALLSERLGEKYFRQLGAARAGVSTVGAFHHPGPRHRCSRPGSSGTCL